jgi:hypothetical protein
MGPVDEIGSVHRVRNEEIGTRARLDAIGIFETENVRRGIAHDAIDPTCQFHVR